MKKIILIATVIVAGYFIYTKNFSVSNKNLSIKKLYDDVSSAPVSAQEAKMAFKEVINFICEINGVDTINGVGTTDECLNNFETIASEYCFSQLNNFDSKVYTSQLAIKADFQAFNRCAMNILMDEPSGGKL